MTSGGSAARRWVRFNAVGVVGFVVQAATLALLTRTALPTSAAIAMAVLAAISHNFVWHERITWPGRPRAERLRRWVSFHLTTGAVSIVANVGLTEVVMVLSGLPVLAANALAVALASLVTFVLSDRVVFGRPRDPCAATR